MTGDLLLRLSARGLALALLLILSSAARATDDRYDPLALAEASVASIELVVHDAPRRRDIPLRVFLPVSAAQSPVLLYSHGLGGSRASAAYLGRHWAARGYVVVCIQHQGSDDAIWRDAPASQRLANLRQAANVRNALLRFGDVPAVLDQLTRWNDTEGAPLARRLDLQRIGMSGHSFGAVTTQAVSGQRTRDGDARFTDNRVLAALVMSPRSPRDGSDPRQAFGGVTIPWMLMTGTHDRSVIGDADVATRLAVFPALPPGAKYELVLDGAQHAAFGDHPLRPDQPARQPRHHRAILALSTAFWDAFLRQDAGARAWLDGPGASEVLEPEDRWQRK